MTSMTGYAYREKNTETAAVSVEIKSVNSRFLDLTVNLPPYLNPLEQRFRERVSEKVVRGKVDVNIRVKNLKGCEHVSVDLEAAKSYAEALANISLATGLLLPDAVKAQTLLPLILQQPGVLQVEQSYDADEYWKLIEPLFNDALAGFTADRKREGENLCRDLTEKLTKLDEAAAFFSEWQPKMEETFKNMILSKFKELLGNQVDEQRVMTETAAMLVKYTINEEVVRLHSHLAALRAEMTGNPAPGKKIDFLCQEINREINTIGSKNMFPEVSAMVVTAKDSLENIREQAKNVE